MHRKGHVLVNSSIFPPDAQRIRIAGLVRLDSLFALETPFSSAVVQLHSRHHLPLTLVSQFPTAHVMTASHDAGSNALCDPRRHNVVTNFSLDAHQIACSHSDLSRMCRMNPQWVSMR